MLSRRRFLKMAGALGVVLLAPFDRLAQKLPSRTSWFDSIEDLRANIDFPIFVPGSLPHKMTFLQGYVVRFAGSGKVWQARIDYGFEDLREPLISLTASPVFYRPYPVWPALGYPKNREERILDEEFFEIEPQKVAFTPRPGIMLPSDEGYILQWTKHDVLYTMFMEHHGWREAPESVGTSLVER